MQLKSIRTWCCWQWIVCLSVFLLKPSTAGVQGQSDSGSAPSLPQTFLPSRGPTATIMFRLSAPEGLLPFDIDKQLQMYSLLPSNALVRPQVLSFCSCPASPDSGAPEFVDLAMKLKALQLGGVDNVVGGAGGGGDAGSGSSAALAGAGSSTVGANLSALYPSAVRLWQSRLQGTIPNITIETLSEEDIVYDNSRPLVRPVLLMDLQMQAMVTGSAAFPQPNVQNVASELVAALRSRLVAADRSTAVSDVRLALPLPTKLGESGLSIINSMLAGEQLSLSLIMTIAIQYCPEGPPTQALGPSTASASAAQPLCLASVPAANDYLEQAFLQTLCGANGPLTKCTASVSPSSGQCTSCATEAQGSWWEGPQTGPQGVPWYLDQLDKRTPANTSSVAAGSGMAPTNTTIDGSFSASALGTGVNVFLVSSGVHASHEEFRTVLPGGQLSSQSRVVALYGLDGQDAAQDCPDYSSFLGIGTFAASVIAGVSTGVARNATIQSVRYKLQCTSEDVRIWGRGGMANALDAVIAKLREGYGRFPGVVVIDGWWTPSRLQTDNDSEIEAELTRRLNELYNLNALVITAAASGQLACENIFSQHNSSVTVGSVDPVNIRSFLTSDAADCIDIWAPGGSLGSTMRAAYPDPSNSSYKSVIPRESGASWLVAGVVAQYLSLHRTATPEEVRQYLFSEASDGSLWDVVGPNKMLYSDLKEPVVVSSGAVRPSQAPSGGVSDAALAGIVVGAVLAGLLLLVVALVIGYRHYRRRPDQNGSVSEDSVASLQRGSIARALVRAAQGGSKGHLSDKSFSGINSKLQYLQDNQWLIAPDAITICTNADGTESVLGEGTFGLVLKAMKDGVQPVAVKVFKGDLSSWTSGPGDMFVREMELLKFVSRDKNIVQFYGCCIKDDHVMLVTELMEGGDMRNALSDDRDGSLRWGGQGKRLALDIVRGLSFLHANKVIHRDLKSKNVLLTSNGVAKICDVGLAKVHDNGYATMDSMIGTFAWAAPELLLGERCTDKADIYSMGVVLWEILTQEVPMRGAINFPEADPLHAPQEVINIAYRCLQQDAKARPSARELYALLAACPPNPEMTPASPHSPSSASVALPLTGNKGSKVGMASASNSGTASELLRVTVDPLSSFQLGSVGTSTSDMVTCTGTVSAADTDGQTDVGHDRASTDGDTVHDHMHTGAGSYEEAHAPRTHGSRQMDEWTNSSRLAVAADVLWLHTTVHSSDTVGHGEACAVDVGGAPDGEGPSAWHTCTDEAAGSTTSGTCADTAVGASGVLTVAGQLGSESGGPSTAGTGGLEQGDARCLGHDQLQQEELLAGHAPAHSDNEQSAAQVLSVAAPSHTNAPLDQVSAHKTAVKLRDGRPGATARHMLADARLLEGVNAAQPLDSDMSQLATVGPCGDCAAATTPAQEGTFPGSWQNRGMGHVGAEMLRVAPVNSSIKLLG